MSSFHQFSLARNPRSLQESQVPETKGKGCSKDVLLVEEDQVRNTSAKRTYLGPWALMRCAHEFSGSWLSLHGHPITSDQSWQQGEMPEDWRKINSTSRRNPQELQVNQHYLSP